MITITREWLQQTIAEFENTRDDIPSGLDDDDAKILKVLKQALSSMEAEPVAWTDAEELRDANTDGCGYLFKANPITVNADPRRVILLYTVQQPEPEREQVRREHAEWSDKTFGNIGPIGPLKHLSREALEAAADPSDPLEWADMQFLLWDAQRRMGISDDFITRAMIEKLAVNKSRQWPEPKDGEPRLHIKERSELIVLDERHQHLSELYHAQEKRLFKIAQHIKGPAFDKYAYSSSQAIDVLEAAIFGEENKACRAAMLQSKYRDLSQPVDPQISEYEKIMLRAGNSPENPDGWISCSERMPEGGDTVLVCQIDGIIFCADVDSGWFCPDEFPNVPKMGREITHWMPLPAAPQQEKDN